MRLEKINGHDIALYDSPEQMPYENYYKLNLCLSIESGIGSSMESVDAHAEMIAKLIDHDPKKAKMELNNMRSSYYFMLNNITPEMDAFFYLVHSIDGVKVDIKEIDLYREQIKKFPYSIKNIVYELKKKLTMNWILFTQRLIRFSLGTYKARRKKHSLS